jgi:hypothetical protein
MIGHYNSLKEKHDVLDKEIEKAYNEHANDIEINKMKTDKLHLKEQMYEIECKLGVEHGKRLLHGNK